MNNNNKKPQIPNSYKKSAIEGQTDATKAGLNLIFTNTIAGGEN